MNQVRKHSEASDSQVGSRAKLRESVVHAKQRLAEGRVKLRAQHEAGSRSIQVCARQTDLLDGVILDLYQTILEDAGEASQDGLRSKLALVPHGGFGRRDLAPFSDVDLLLLRHPSASYTRVSRIASRLLADISDLGVTPGFAVRTPNEACSWAKKDPAILTSQAEARYLSGSVRLFAKFMRRFRRLIMRNHRSFIRLIEESRRAERRQYGETVFLLEPNVKRSRGGLRDIQLLRWIGFARYGETDPASLRLMGELSREDERALRKALEFLLRVRNELHYYKDSTHDVLHRGEQQRIAELWGYPGDEHVLPVENFMREYFEHTQQVRNIVGHFRGNAMQRSWVSRTFAPLFSHRHDDHYLVGPRHIAATRRGLATLRGDLAEVLHIMDLANQMDKHIDHDTWAAIRTDMMGRDDMVVTAETAKRFLSLLSYTARLGSLLRWLHELRVLEKLVAGMDHARCLLQFNRYHKYTVDEHCLRAVERATEFQTDLGPLGDAYRSIKRRHILHLALLIHDLGKGFAGDHSDIGKDLAGETAQRLKLSEEESELLQFLVHKHLVMSHLAFRRDTSDENLILQFASEVGSAEYLRMLYVLTGADLASVGPGVLNPWKIDVLTGVYRRTLQHLAGSSPATPSQQGDVPRRRELLLERTDETDEWIRRQIAGLPAAYLLETRTHMILEDLEKIRDIELDRVKSWGAYIPERNVTEYTIGIHEDNAEGIFHRLAGALRRNRLQILSAQIHTFSEGLALDRFCVEDEDFSGEPTASRLEEVSRELVKAIESPTDEAPVFSQTWRSAATSQDGWHVQPTRISIDNMTSPDYTIIDVFTHDRPGLLYAITRALYELETSVGYAKIGTYIDQVVDVFYVTDLVGNRILGDNDIETIKHRLLAAIESVHNATA